VSTSSASKLSDLNGPNWAADRLISGPGAQPNPRVRDRVPERYFFAFLAAGFFAAATFLAGAFFAGAFFAAAFAMVVVPSVLSMRPNHFEQVNYD
jgi:hypothetical protein